MPTFVETCSCNGHGPQNVVNAKHYSRPDVIGKLLKDRTQIRVLSAPAGFGKSTVAYEYAGIMFSFKKMFWISCKSPCFIRDLDLNVLFEQIMECFKNPKLVVFEDLPLLDERRVQTFCRLLDNLLAVGCEVILTCTPKCETVSAARQNAVVFGWNNLLLSESELSIDVLAGRITEEQYSNLTTFDRIVGWAWSPDKDAGLKTVNSILNEDCGQIFNATSFLLLLFGEGHIENLQAFVPRDDLCVIFGKLEKSYGIFGIDMSNETFASVLFDLPQLKRSFQPIYADIAAACGYSSADDFTSDVALHLLHLRKFERCALFLKEFATLSALCRWVAKYAWSFILQGQPQFASALLDSARKNYSTYYSQYCVIELFAAYQLEDIEALSKCIRKVLKSAKANNASKKIALSFACLYFNPSEARRILGALSFVLNEPVALKDNAEQRDERFPADCLLKIATSMLEDGVDAFSVWQDCLKQFKSTLKSEKEKTLDPASILAKDALLLSADWLLRYVIDDEFSAPQMVSSCVEGVLGVIGSSPFDKNYITSDEGVVCVSWFEACVLVSLCDVELCGDDRLCDLGHESAVTRSFAMLDAIGEQKLAYVQQKAQLAHSRMNYNKTHPDAYRRKASSKTFKPLQYSGISVPSIEINLFGGFRIFRSTNAINQNFFAREKVKILLILLLLNKGREMSRDSLAFSLWPTSSLDTQRRNFYSVWSGLKSALAIEDYCPYLIKTKGGCFLDMEYVKSDIFEFERLCKMLTFELDPVLWRDYIQDVQENYSIGFLPEGYFCETIDTYRKYTETRLVDSLTVAAEQLCDYGEARGAYMFAREALRHDSRREDCYASLMRAQIMLGQRAGAIDTYLECKSFLNEELGIDPSKKLMSLYREIIES